jgi:hypothetical protein
LLLPAGFGRWAAFSFCLPEAGACGRCFSVESRRARYLVCLPDVSLLLRRPGREDFPEAVFSSFFQAEGNGSYALPVRPCRFWKGVLIVFSAAVRLRAVLEPEAPGVFSAAVRPRAVLEPEAPGGFSLTVWRGGDAFFIRAAAGFRAAVL